MGANERYSHVLFGSTSCHSASVNRIILRVLAATVELNGALGEKNVITLFYRGKKGNLDKISLAARADLRSAVALGAVV